jgi:hypothetical protein
MLGLLHGINNRGWPLRVLHSLLTLVSQTRIDLVPSSTAPAIHESNHTTTTTAALHSQSPRVNESGDPS